MSGQVVRYVIVLFLVLVLGADGWTRELKIGAQGDYISLTAAVKAAQPGDVLFLAAGVYAEPLESYPVEIDIPITLMGEAGSILKGPPFESLLRINSPDVTIVNVEFHFLRWGIVNTGDNLTLSECGFLLADTRHRISSNGVWLAGAYNCRILDCRFEGCGVCIAGPPLDGRSKGLPVLTGLFEVGGDIEFFTTHTLNNNTVNGKPLYYFVNEANLVVPSDAGGLIAAGCDNITVQGIDVSDSSMGMQVVYCDNAVIEDVTADRCGIFGVYVAESNRPMLRNVNCSESNHGIDLRAVQNGYVADCTTHNCEQGIFLSFVMDSIVDNCSIFGGGSGLFAAAGARNQLSGCFVTDNGNGVYIQNEKDMLVCGNEVLGNTVAGMRFLRSGGQIIANYILDNWVGVLAAEANPLTLWNNSFKGNACTALYLKDIGSGKISFNVFDADGKAALEFDGSLTDTIILQNLFFGGKEHVEDRTEGGISLDMNIWEE